MSVIRSEIVGYCHPAQSKRTKCVCGATCRLVFVGTVCDCGRIHRRQPGVSAFARTGYKGQATRPGGTLGCPGVGTEKPKKTSKPRTPTATAKCVEYLKRTGDLPSAVALAKKDGFSANTSVWLGALGDLLGTGRFK